MALNEDLGALLGASEELQRKLNEFQGSAESFKNEFGFSADAVTNLTSKLEVAFELLKNGDITQGQFNQKLSKAKELALIFQRTQANIAEKNNDEVTEFSKQVSEAFDNLTNAAESSSDSQKTLTGRLKDAGQVANRFFGTPAGLVTAGLGAVAKIALQLDDRFTNISKGLNLTNAEAAELFSNFNQIANASENLNITAGRLFGSFAEINKQLGFIANLSSETLTDFTKLTNQTKLTAEEAKAFFDISVLTGESIDNITGDALVTARALQEQKGIQTSQEQILREISQISKATLLSNRGNVDALAEAVENARELGVELNAVEKISESLLDIETSIANEFQAELLTGRQLNLERARAAALNNDIATVAEEITKQNISAAEFGNLNRIAQDALANSLGLQREELAEALLLQEAQEKTRAELVALGREDLIELRDRTSAQERLSAATERIQDLFVNIGTILLPIAESIAAFAESTNRLIAPLAGEIIEGTATARGAVRGGFQSVVGEDVVSEIRNTNKLLSANANKNTIIRMNGTAVGEAASVDTRIS